MDSPDTNSNDSDEPPADEETQNRLRERLRAATRTVFVAITAFPHAIPVLSGVVVAVGGTPLPAVRSALLTISLRRAVQGVYHQRPERTGRPGLQMGLPMGARKAVK